MRVFLFLGFAPERTAPVDDDVAPWVFTMGRPSHGHGSSFCFFCSRSPYGLVISYESDYKICMFDTKRQQKTAAHRKTQKKLKADSLVKKNELNMNLHLRLHP